jgi:hypothetical protein
MTVTPPEGTKTDAIGFFIEHQDAEPVQVLLPYSRKRFRGVSYGELFAVPGERRVFGAAE